MEELPSILKSREHQEPSMMPMDGRASSHHSSSNSLDKNSTRDKRDVDNMDTRTKSQPEKGN